MAEKQLKLMFFVSFILYMYKALPCNHLTCIIFLLFARSTHRVLQSLEDRIFTPFNCERGQNL